MTGTKILCLVIGYCFGMFQTAYIYGRIKGIDIRQKGSGNAGTTNALRVLGKKAGLYVMLADLGKIIIAVTLVYFLFRNTYPEEIYLLKLYTGLGGILGHNFPFYLGFKGGKGIAAMGGMILAFHWSYIPQNLLLFFGMVALTHYVSLSSMLLTVSFFVQTLLMCIFGGFKAYGGGEIPREILTEMIIVAFIISAMAFIRHHENIKKLLNGTERKTYVFKKNKPEADSGKSPEGQEETK